VYNVALHLIKALASLIFLLNKYLKENLGHQREIHSNLHKLCGRR
jgi:hypothetical protein